MVGIGLTPEGIFQNEVIYEFMNENAYTKEPREITKWYVCTYVIVGKTRSNTSAVDFLKIPGITCSIVKSNF